MECVWALVLVAVILDRMSHITHKVIVLLRIDVRNETQWVQLRHKLFSKDLVQWKINHNIGSTKATNIVEFEYQTTS